MNSELLKLQPYPFAKLAQLKSDLTPPSELRHVDLSIGEPKHATPMFIREALNENGADFARYPATRGTEALREAIADWATNRFQLQGLDPASQVLPVNGTREALFAFAQTVVDRQTLGDTPIVISPNPFYQIYEGAALLAGAEPYYVNCTADNGFLPDFDSVPESTWARCQLVYICSPGNPSGMVMDIDSLQTLIQRADQYGFIIAADECYSELYADDDAPPVGLLQAAAQMGRHDFKNCVVFHSLSKRSNCPGLRSGFVAGDAEVLEKFFQYRTYHGSAMSMPLQAASTVAWRDEDHVCENRRLYRAKYEAVMEILSPVMNIVRPPAGFYLWPDSPGPDEEFTRELFIKQHVTVIPGSFLSRVAADGTNPGAGRIRIALVFPLEDCVEAAERMRKLLN
ncbi:MAG: succinyldiaminopimelate transaminase, partial [Pseudomonadota bacterium]